MPIKQIKLRGISRNPSDRVVEDGGCAESLNIHIQDQELVPTLAARNITEELGLADEDELFLPSVEIIFIHRRPGSTVDNYVGYDAGQNTISFFVDGQWQELTYALGTGETVKGITSIGNTVILTTDTNVYYYLYKEGAYSFLGNRIPEPKILFKCEKQEDEEGFLTPDDFGYISGSGVPTEDTSHNVALTFFTANSISTQAKHDGTLSAAQGYILDNANKHVRAYKLGGEEEFENAYCDEICDELAMRIWDKFGTARRNHIADNEFTAPLLVTYAVRMYDGSYIYRSSPMLLNGGVYEYILAKFRSDGNNCAQGFYLKDIFTATVDVEWDAGDWSDIVSSVDIFYSVDVLTPRLNSKITGRYMLSPASVYGYLFDGMHNPWADEITLSRLLEASVFYNVLSFEVDKSGISTGISETLKPYSQDELVVRRRLPDGFQDMHSLIPAGDLYAYNNRLIGTKCRTMLYTGYPYMQSTCVNGSETTAAPTYTHVVYTVKTPVGKTCRIYSVSAAGNNSFAPPYTGAHTYGFITYPDANCIAVDFYYMHGSRMIHRRHVDMKEHPSLECAYGYWGIGATLESITNQQASVPAEDKEYFRTGYLIMSEVDNPFVFPAGGRMKFDSEIVGIATTTKPLSTGQFGQFPLYVFTKDGINAIAINSDGTFGSHSPVSREVAIGGTVTPMEQAILFTTSRGVMMLTGSDVKDISPYMKGEHYYLPDGDAKTKLSASAVWSPLVDAISDTDPFITFAATAKIVYDYTGSRLILLNPNKPYAYVYMFRSDTWHKITLDADVAFSRQLNSYPKAYISMYKDDDGYAVYDFTTVLADAAVSPLSGDTTKSIIITRAMDFNETDIRKALKTLRIRGHHNVNDVKYLLLASMDGINWGLLSTLRGGSYKLFRLIILANLAPTETISWIDVDYEPRFTNKLR